MKDKIVDALLDDVRDSQERMLVIQGLTLAQIVCRRHLLDAFDGKGGQELILSIMGEISDTATHLREQVNYDKTKRPGE